MMIERQSKDGFVDRREADEALGAFVAQNDFTGKRVLVLIPDNTRSGPIGDVFRLLYDHLAPRAKAVDCLVALGTHPPLSERQICKRLSMTLSERKTMYDRVQFFNHEWDKPETFASLGKITADEIEELSGGLFREEVDVRINKRLFDYDTFLILGPVFPHEVVGFSGGHKYIFPGIAGEEIINFFHWLGAVITNPAINGCKWTPTRKVVERAAALVDIPHALVAVVAVEGRLKGLFLGDCLQAWERAADLSHEVHIVYKDRPYRTILGLCPEMYDDIWTAGKVMYKLEPIVADGGTLIIYAPHITEISYTHGKVLDRIGYHTRDYFLKQMDQFRDIPRSSMAHATHVKGCGTFEAGVEKPRVNVVLATGIGPERCRQVNLGYMDPQEIRIADYENREAEGVLVVPHAGEILHRLAPGATSPAPRI
jgi:nickel-dependent lactate racemase